MSGRIRPLALCVFRRADNAILVAPGHDSVKNQVFYRPIGGEIEFGEAAVDAARREVREELGVEVEDLRLLAVLENRFVYLGEAGHELVWLFEGRFQDGSIYQQERLTADEGGHAFPVDWVHLAHFVEGRAPLYPDGLLALLTKA